MITIKSNDIVKCSKLFFYYFLFQNQWRIGHTSLFAHALGVVPFKDVFKTYNFGVDETDTESTSQYCLMIKELEGMHMVQTISQLAIYLTHILAIRVVNSLICTW